MTKYLKIALVLLLVAALAAVGTGRRRGSFSPVERDGFVMDTIVRITIHAMEGEAKGERAAKALDDVFERLSEMDGHYSMYRPDSAISRINANAGLGAVAVSNDVYEMLEAALDMARLTEGAFDPTVGPLTVLWNVTAGEASDFRVPGDGEIERALSLVGYDNLKLDDYLRVELNPRGARLDLGGVAKGYATGFIDGYLRAAGVTSAIIDMGGNIAVIGARPDGEDWRIGIQYPGRPRGVPLAAVALRDSSVITAGIYERYSELDGALYPHIFDPRSGRPVSGDVLSATVVSRNPTAADALSTALVVAGDAARSAVQDLGAPPQTPPGNQSPGPPYYFYFHPQGENKNIEWGLGTESPAGLGGAQGLAPRFGDAEAVLVVKDGDRLKVLATEGLRGKLRMMSEDADLEYIGGQKR